MAINIYQAITNPISKETFRAISFDDEAFVMEWIVQPQGYVPFEHVHLRQDEIFHVQEGELNIVINGSDHIAGKGNSITVPKGKKHIAYNNKPETMKALVEYKPGLDYDKFLQCLTGLTLDGFIDKKGGINIPKMGYCLKKMKCRAMARPTAIPAPLFNMSLFFFYIAGVLSNWEKLYRNYVY
jgi:quercetin dioxygenase-like cupin family protein